MHQPDCPCRDARRLVTQRLEQAQLECAQGAFGGLGLLVGLLSRVAAFGVAMNMLVAIFTVHINNGFFANWSGQQKGEGFEYHLLAIAVMLVLMVRGSGAASVDRALSGQSA